MRKILLIIILFVTGSSIAQDNVFAFYEYDIKSGMTDQFIDGYARDLEWHKSQEDDWSWIGWFVINGERRGRFIDATPDHSWSDFDKWKVNSSENARLNKIHWVPYIENPSGSYRIIMDDFSSYKNDWYKSKFLQVYFIEIRPGEKEKFEQLLKSELFVQNKLKGISFVWMKTISGDSDNEYCLFVALNKIEDLSLCVNLFDFSTSQKELLEGYKNSVIQNRSELWNYSESLSLFFN